MTARARKQSSAQAQAWWPPDAFILPQKAYNRCMSHPKSMVIEEKIVFHSPDKYYLWKRSRTHRYPDPRLFAVRIRNTRRVRKALKAA